MPLSAPSASFGFGFDFAQPKAQDNVSAVSSYDCSRHYRSTHEHDTRI